MKRSLHILAAALVLTFGLALAPANAIDTLTSGNSTVRIDPTSQAGVFDWTVDGLDQLFQQAWFVGVGTAPQRSIDTISAAQTTTLTNTFAAYTYENAATRVQTTYSLLGGSPSSHTSDLGEQFQLTNRTATSQTYHIFLYSDFDLGGQVGNQTVRIESPGDLDDAFQTLTNQSFRVNTVVTPDANRGEVNTFANTLNSLNGGVYQLNNNLGPLSPADATWALEWDVTVGPGGVFSLSVDKNIVPVPPAVWLVGTGLLGLLGLRRKLKA